MSDTAAPAAPAATPAPASSPAPTSAKPAQSTKTAQPATPHASSSQTPTAPNSKLADAPTGDAATSGGETPAQAAERKARVLKLKVYGKESDYDLDNTPDEKIARDLQMGAAAQRALQEKAEIEKQHRSFMEALKKDPLAALKDPNIGVDVRKLVEDQLIAEFEKQQKLSGLPPEAREAYERAERAEREASELRAEKEKVQSEFRQRLIAETKAKEQQRLESEFMGALETGGLPKNRQTVAMMAEIAAFNLQHGIELSPQQLAAEVRDRLSGMQKHVMGGLKGDALVKYLGDDIVREVIRHSVSKVKQPSSASAKTFEPPTPVAAKASDDAKPTKRRSRFDEPKDDRKTKDPRDLREFFRGR